MLSENAAKLPVLIDADNAQSSAVEDLLAEVAKYGTEVGREGVCGQSAGLRIVRAQFGKHSVHVVDVSYAVESYRPSPASTPGLGMAFERQRFFFITRRIGGARRSPAYACHGGDTRGRPAR